MTPSTSPSKREPLDRASFGLFGVYFIYDNAGRNWNDEYFTSIAPLQAALLKEIRVATLWAVERQNREYEFYWDALTWLNGSARPRRLSRIPEIRLLDRVMRSLASDQEDQGAIKRLAEESALKNITTRHTWEDAKFTIKETEALARTDPARIRVAIDEAIGINAAWYCWHASRRQAMVESVWEKSGAFVHQQIIWVKDRPILTRSWYTWQHEPCFFGWVRPHKPVRRAEDYPSSIWHIPTVRIGQVTEHPTSKPLEVFRIPIRQHTRAGELCYEPFAGSGSQIIAAEQLGRRCNAIEISPRYCDVIVRRYIAYVGESNVDPNLAERYRLEHQPLKAGRCA